MEEMLSFHSLARSVEIFLLVTVLFGVWISHPITSRTDNMPLYLGYTSQLALHPPSSSIPS